LEATVRRDRILIGVCLAAIVALSWIYLVDMAGEMSGMDTAGMSEMAMTMPDMVMSATGAWSVRELTLLWVMWIVMMIGMMVPSASPMIFAFLGVNQRRRSARRPVVPTYVFVLGYVGIWAAYSALAALAQWGLHQAAVISPSMAVTSPFLQGGLLLSAGIFQWTPLKRACLAGCRSPLSFLMSEWREGRWGAFVMGLRHGGYCVGCCWILMALLFVAGVMNLFWIAAIAVFVLAEKLLPRGEVVGKIAGLVLAAAGLAVLVSEALIP
jgi:predicted metal-binding membrane protein